MKAKIGDFMIKGYKCSEGAVSFIAMKKFGSLSWCRYCLPCCRCIEPQFKCSCQRDTVSFDCDNCQYKFLCLTCDGYEWQKDVQV